MIFFIKRIFALFFCIFSVSFIYAGEKFKLNDSQCIGTQVNDINLDVYITDCNKKIRKIDSIEVPDDIARVEYVFSKDKKIYIAYSYNEDYRDYSKNYNYVDKYFLINSYDCNENSYCKYNFLVSNYFGGGGDILNRKTKKIVYNYPYSKKEFLIKEIQSKRFGEWFNGKLTNGKVVRKTFINDVNNFSTEHKGYLVKGDSFLVDEISSGWLRVKYKNKVGKITRGWINCKDTNICD
ncbi:hypothetical protein [Acinetobacter sp. 1000160]|uniref:hypothetical protein n=1 Tax=Acinetobacter sp. 1000160 TaxID=1310800 RepID=UPI0004521A80|nr:hypothetical protein [Acinetobacter sp. 1000160]EXB47228.1 hypothetical protein J522_1879 [Acinetobacter baumannii 146457]EYT23523.1 hypothetical protein J699_00029 [Acinetobacter sp. 1000160]